MSRLIRYLYNIVTIYSGQVLSRSPCLRHGANPLPRSKCYRGGNGGLSRSLRKQCEMAVRMCRFGTGGGGNELQASLL